MKMMKKLGFFGTGFLLYTLFNNCGHDYSSSLTLDFEMNYPKQTLTMVINSNDDNYQNRILTQKFPPGVYYPCVSMANETVSLEEL